MRTASSPEEGKCYRFRVLYGNDTPTGVFGGVFALFDNNMLSFFSDDVKVISTKGLETYRKNYVEKGTAM